jgi:hypothetical protein
MKIQDRYCQGLSASSRSQRRTVDAETVSVIPRAASSAANSGHDQRAIGTPVSAGNWQASALASATCTGVNRAGHPERLWSARADSPPSATRPRQVRTVSTCRWVSAAIRALLRPRAASSTTVARSRA